MNGYQQSGRTAVCPKCGANATMIETVADNQIARAYFCNCCGQGWTAPVHRETTTK